MSIVFQGQTYLRDLMGIKKNRNSTNKTKIIKLNTYILPSMYKYRDMVQCKHHFVGRTNKYFISEHIGWVCFGL